MTRFRPTIKGYFMLGLFFLLFVGIPSAFVIMILSMPPTILGAMAGNIYLTVALVFLLLAVVFVVMGWFIFRFVKGNQFG